MIGGRLVRGASQISNMPAHRHAERRWRARLGTDRLNQTCTCRSATFASSSTSRVPSSSRRGPPCGRKPCYRPWAPWATASTTRSSNRSGAACRSSSSTQALVDTSRACQCHLRVPRDLPQPPTAALLARYAQPGRVRGSPSTNTGSVSPRTPLHRTRGTPKTEHTGAVCRTRPSRASQRGVIDAPVVPSSIVP